MLKCICTLSNYTCTSPKCKRTLCYSQVACDFWLRRYVDKIEVEHSPNDLVCLSSYVHLYLIKVYINLTKVHTYLTKVHMYFTKVHTYLAWWSSGLRPWAGVACWPDWSRKLLQRPRKPEGQSRRHHRQNLQTLVALNTKRGYWHKCI